MDAAGIETRESWLQRALVDLDERLTATRLELADSDAIRGFLHGSLVDDAKSMVRALTMVEVAFRAGYAAGREGDPKSYADRAYRTWSEGLKLV
jgi:hypothetical protein